MKTKSFDKYAKKRLTKAELKAIEPKEKIVRAAINFTKERRLKDGSSRFNVPLRKDLQKALFDEAIKDNTLTLSELKYQAAGRNNTSFYQLVVAAQLVRKLAEYADKTIEETTGQKSKIANDIRLNVI